MSYHTNIRCMQINFHRIEVAYLVKRFGSKSSRKKDTHKRWIHTGAEVTGDQKRATVSLWKLVIKL